MVSLRLEIYRFESCPGYKINKVMNIEDVKLFCKLCNKEIPLTVFQKTGLMGIHNQYESIPEICDECKEESNEETIDFKTK